MKWCIFSAGFETTQTNAAVTCQPRWCIQEAAKPCRVTQWVACIRYIRCQTASQSRCTVRWLSVAEASPSFHAAWQEGLIPSRLSTHYFKTEKPSCWSCRRRLLTAVSPTLWSSLIRILLPLPSELMSTVSAVTLLQRMLSWEITSFLGSFQHTRRDVAVTKASDLMGTPSVSEIVTQIQTASLRSCQITISKPQAEELGLWKDRCRSKLVFKGCTHRSSWSHDAKRVLFPYRGAFWWLWLLHVQQPLEQVWFSCYCHCNSLKLNFTLPTSRLDIIWGADSSFHCSSLSTISMDFRDCSWFDSIKIFMEGHFNLKTQVFFTWHWYVLDVKTAGISEAIIKFINDLKND